MFSLEIENEGIEELRYVGIGVNQDSGQAEIYLGNKSGSVLPFNVSLVFQEIGGDSSNEGINWVGFDDPTLYIHREDNQAMVNDRHIGIFGYKGIIVEAIKHFTDYITSYPVIKRFPN